MILSKEQCDTILKEVWRIWGPLKEGFRQEFDAFNLVVNQDPALREALKPFNVKYRKNGQLREGNAGEKRIANWLLNVRNREYCGIMIRMDDQGWCHVVGPYPVLASRRLAPR